VRGRDYNCWGFSSSISRIVLGVLDFERVTPIHVLLDFVLGPGQPLIDTIYPTKREADKTSLSGGSKI
jgi:hypothetical protein